MKHQPILAKPATAAKLLDMTPAEFRAWAERVGVVPHFEGRYLVSQINKKVEQGGKLMPSDVDWS